MLTFYSRVAGWLKPVRLVLWLMLCVAVITFGWVVLNPVNPEQNLVFLGSVLLFGWALCLLMIQAHFSQPIEWPTPTDSVVLKFKKRLMIAFSWGLALLVTGLTAKMLLLTVQVVNVLTSISGKG
jgi:hypothetical protein